jgi:hypothetical protein
VIRVPGTLLQTTFEIVRRCGRGRRECQALWIAQLGELTTVVDVAHPDHRSHAGGFHVDNAWLTSLWIDLAKNRRSIIAQVHTHPERAFHSRTDDLFPIIHTPGFVSIVFPRFGFGELGLAGSFVTQIGTDGAWHAQIPSSTIILT